MTEIGRNDVCQEVCIEEHVLRNTTQQSDKCLHSLFFHIAHKNVRIGRNDVCQEVCIKEHALHNTMQHSDKCLHSLFLHVAHK